MLLTEWLSRTDPVIFPHSPKRSTRCQQRVIAQYISGSFGEYEAQLCPFIVEFVQSKVGEPS